MNTSVFVKAKCLNTGKLYYYRYDLNASNRWILSTATEEEYREETAYMQSSGSMSEVDNKHAVYSPQYHGCPFCSNQSFVTCSCGVTLHCFPKGRQKTSFVCPETRISHKVGNAGIPKLSGCVGGQ